MNSDEIQKIAERIDEGVDAIQLMIGRIKTRLNINTGIFGLTFLVLCGVIFMGYKLNAKQERNFNLATESLKQSAVANAKLDATDNLYTTYIKTTVGQILDKLQKDNPQIKVPKAPVPRPPGLPPINEEEMERPISERVKVAPMPLPNKAGPLVKYRSKPKPTPKPWHWPWGTKQTR